MTETATAPAEQIIEPELPIIDAHHHLWFHSDAFLAGMETVESGMVRKLAPIFRRGRRYLSDEFLAETRCGHNVVASVFVETFFMYRADGPAHLASVGEVEVANGVGAMFASGLFGDARLCAAIIGGVDLTMGERVEEVLAAQARAGGDRYRGVRNHVFYDDDPDLCPPGHAHPHVLQSEAFLAGFRRLAPHGLLYEGYVLEPQLPELVALARAHPETRIVLNHTGGPLGMGRYAGRREERFPVWRQSIQALAACPNVTAKLGGLGMPTAGFDADGARASADLARLWRPYVETCIEAFGPDRCMFESNFPVDSGACTYAALWNAFKILAAQYNPAERTALFSGTAARTYHIAVPGARHS
jgi:predicted TIM-barrel fold metal-dependent hydrolase